MYSQILMPTGREDAMHFLDLLDRMVREVPAYVISCNMQPEAALVAYRAMKGE
jgi:hypothetical protein